jgi:alkaline phosphatase
MSDPTSLARRDWLKATSLGAAAAIFGTTASAQANPPRKRTKGIVFMVSDGMSPGVFTLAEAFSQNTRGKGTAWWSLWDDANAARGLMDTASANSLVTDSAAAATSWGGGQRVNNGAINTNPSGKRIEPIATLLKAGGAKLGLVTTTRLTHATPAGFASSVQNRGQEDDIAAQYPGNADILLGGGAKHFHPRQRKDNQDVRGEFEKAGYAMVHDRAGLLASREAKLLGIFHDDHLPYSVDHLNDPALKIAVPTLAEMTSAALDRFLAQDAPFLLVVEGGRVDHAAHMNCIAGVLGDQLAFDDAVAATLAKIAGRDDILVVVTSDHGNANPGLNGMGSSYQRSNESFAHVAKIAITHETLCIKWQTAKRTGRTDLAAFIRGHLHFDATPAELEAIRTALDEQKAEDWNHQHRNRDGLLGQIVGNHTGIGWTGVSHTADPTLVSATGPGAERFGGLVVNADVNRHLRELLLE